MPVTNEMSGIALRKMSGTGEEPQHISVLAACALNTRHNVGIQAYNILRHSAGLLLSLLHLMAGAPVTDLAADPSKALLKLQVRLWALHRLVCPVLNALVCLIAKDFEHWHGIPPHQIV
jgi:hypothetical protein